mmetsp:Transcript_6977/g.20749  ORF Transcript_6977/g.20749 Transcript_6977/m.20749 type:complete len:203 (-) Transcript_6977:3231-3839(-)
MSIISGVSGTVAFVWNARGAEVELHPEAFRHSQESSYRVPGRKFGTCEARRKPVGSASEGTWPRSWWRLVAPCSSNARWSAGVKPPAHNLLLPDKSSARSNTGDLMSNAHSRRARCGWGSPVSATTSSAESGPSTRTSLTLASTIGALQLYGKRNAKSADVCPVFKISRFATSAGRFRRVVIGPKMFEKSPLPFLFMARTVK